MNFITLFNMSKFGNKLIQILSQIKSNEFTTSFRGFDIKNLKGFDLNNVRTKGYSFFMESLYQLNKNNYEILEVPIFFKNRTAGKSKIPKIEIFRTLKNLLLLKFFSK